MLERKQKNHSNCTGKSVADVVAVGMETSLKAVEARHSYKSNYGLQ